MTAMGRDEEVISGPQHPGLGFSLEAQAGATREEHHPFIRVLVVPFLRGSGLAPGHNAFQTEMRGFPQNFNNFLEGSLGPGGKQILHNIAS